MSVSQQDIKKLFGRSAGRCNICKKELTQEDVDKLIAHALHYVEYKNDYR